MMKNLKLKKIFWLVIIVGVLAVAYGNDSIAIGSEDNIKTTIDMSVSPNAHAEFNYETIYDIDMINYQTGYYKVNISNICLQLEDGTYTTKYNNYIEFEFYQLDEFTLQSGQTSFVTQTFYMDADFEHKLCFINHDYYLPPGKISFDISVIKINSKPKKSKTKKSNITCKTKKISFYLDQGGKNISVKGARSRVKWKSSNKNVASVEVDDTTEYDNKARIYPEKIGSCYIYATCEGKKIKCKVTVKGRKNLKIFGGLEAYRTRTNTFRLRVINYSEKKITLCKTGAVAVDQDYTAFDRRLRLRKAITILPGKYKTVSYKVIGRHTWWDVDDFCLNYSVKYKNKTYRMASDDETTWIRRKGKWKVHNN